MWLLLVPVAAAADALYLAGDVLSRIVRRFA
jgi:hypothetical protein